MWHRITGQPSVAESLQTGLDQTVTARSRGATIVVLADDPQHTSYRLQAEVRHDFAGRADCGAGLIVGMCESPFGNGVIQSGCLLRFNDLRDARDTQQQVQALRPDLRIPQIVGNRLRFMPYIILARDDLSEPVEANLAGADLMFAPAYNGQRWRKIEVEVHPDLMRARWENGEPLTLRTAECRARIQERLGTLYQRFAISPPDALPVLDARGALGVYVRNGTVSFRNVTLERIQPIVE